MRHFLDRYSLFEIESNVAPKQRLLVLASNHGIDQNGERLSYTVKLDYLPAIGGEVCYHSIVCCTSANFDSRLLLAYE